MPVKVVANAPLRVPGGAAVEMIVCPGFGAADDWITERAGPGDVVVSADVPLAVRCVATGPAALDPKGRPFTDSDIGAALAMRDLREELRQSGVVTSGPTPMTPKDRSRFLGKLDELISAARRNHPQP